MGMGPWSDSRVVWALSASDFLKNAKTEIDDESYLEQILGINPSGKQSCCFAADLFQTNSETQPLIEAIVEDNPSVVVEESPGMTKLDVVGRLTIKRETVSKKIGRDFDLQEIHINLISISGNLDEDDDEFVISWG